MAQNGHTPAGFRVCLRRRSLGRGSDSVLQLTYAGGYKRFSLAIILAGLFLASCSTVPLPVGPLAENEATSIHPKTRPETPRAPSKQSDLQPKKVKTVTYKITGTGPARRSTTQLVEFENAPFPYHGVVPGKGKFLDVGDGSRKGRLVSAGRVLWESETYSDRRVLLHMPKGFDVNRPAVAVMFFHGHGARLDRDVRDRQQVPAQISAAGINAVLIAPQFAVDAPDSSAGRFWEENACGRFYDEAAAQLARIYGAPDKAPLFAKIPVIIVAYSGGYVPAAACLENGNLKAEIKGVMLMDGLYGELDTFAGWIAKSKSSFFVSAFTDLTSGRNAELKRILSEKGVAYSSELNRNSWKKGVTFVSTGSNANHKDYVTQAWVSNPIKDALAKLVQY